MLVLDVLSSEFGGPTCTILRMSGESAPIPYASVANSSLISPSFFLRSPATFFFF